MKSMMSISIAVQSGVPVLLRGAPGIGKTSLVKAVARALALPIETVIASIREPADFGGLPVIMPEGGVRLEPPAWAKRLAREGRGILFFDECDKAPPAVQNALLRVILEGVVGEEKLPEGVFRVAAVNSSSPRDGGWGLTEPLATRFCHIHCKVDPMQWVKGMTQGWPPPRIVVLPDGWRDYIPQARAVVASFIAHRPDLLVVEGDNSSEDKPLARPRTWEMAAQLLAACQSVDAPSDVTTELIAGCVGEGPALEFLWWRQNADLPNPEEILAAPDSCEIPERGDILFAVLSGIVAVISARPTPERWQSAWTVISRVCQRGQKDQALLAAQALAEIRQPGWKWPPQVVDLIMALGLGLGGRKG